MRWLVMVGILLSGRVVTGEPSARLAYLEALRHELAEIWRPQAVERAQLDAGDLGPWITQVRVSVSADGTLRDVHVTSPSGVPAFDDEALRAFRTIHYPIAPPELVDATGALEFPWTMSTEGRRPPDYLGDPFGHTPATAAWQIGTAFDLERRTTARTGSTTTAGDASYNRSTIDVTASYAITHIGLFELNLPIGTIHYQERSSATDSTVTGLGDATLHFHRGGSFHGLRFNYFLGAELPTGSTQAMPVVGTALPTVIELGSGTFNPDLSECLSLPLTATGSIGLCEHSRFVLYTNSRGYRDPTTFDTRLSVSWSFLDRKLSARAGLLLQRIGTASLQGHALPDTGQATLFAEASAWFTLYRSWSLRATLDVPLYEHVDGTQLAESLVLSTGLAYDFGR